MAIEVEGPDGVVIEFPEGTAHETIKSVMAKRYEKPPEAPKKAGMFSGDYSPRSLAKGVASGFGDIVEAAGDNLGIVGNPLNATINAIAGTNLSTNLGKTARQTSGLPDNTNATASTINKLGAGMMMFPRLPVPRGRAGYVPTAAAISGAKALPKPTVSGMAQTALATALDVVKAGKKEGVRVMTSDIKPPRTFIGKTARAFGERIPIAGTGAPRAVQQEERIAAVTNLLKDFGAEHGDDVIGAVAKDFQATRGSAIAGLTRQKNSVIEGVQGAVQAPKAIAAIDEQVARLSGINSEAYAPVIAKLQSFKQQLASGKNLSQIEGNRKLLGDLFADPSLASIRGDGQKALNAIYGPLREDMGAFIQSQGGQQAYNKWANANKQLSSMAGELDASAFKSALNKIETTPEAVASLLFNKNASEVKRLYGSLSATGRNKAQAAILLKAAEGAAEDTAMGKIISPQKFANAIEAMDKATGVFFANPDKARIDGFTRLLKATQEASVASVAPPTGVQNTIPAMTAGLVGLFGGLKGLAAAGGYGVLARAYESAPVRDALLRVGRMKPGTKAESDAMNNAANYISRMIPVAANDAETALAQSPGRAAAQDEQN